MNHSYDMLVALAAQRRSQLETEAAHHRLVQNARRARRSGAHPGAHRLRARALSVVTRLGVRLSDIRRRATTDTEALRQAGPTADIVDLTAIPAAHPAQLVDARPEGDRRTARCG